MQNRNYLTLTIFYFLTIFLLSSCKSTIALPTIEYKQYEYERSYNYKQDTLLVTLNNPLHCPLRVWIISFDEELQTKFSKILPITLNPVSDTILIFTNINKKVEKLGFSSLLGSVSKKVENIEVDLPFPTNKKYKILQGNNTNFTHNTDYSRYALDFDLKTNDTICSATDGFVVGIIDKYKYGGKEKKWEPYANYITIYDPISGIFTQYVHLVQNGSLVKIGDEVKRGQKIALSGNTGLSTEEHLHFACLIPVDNEDGLKSIPINFVGGIKGINLKQGDELKK